MKSLIIKDLRCFGGEHIVPLAPMVFLVGENSSGKTTFLAAIRSAWDMFFGNRRAAFNEPPFHFGAFDRMVNARCKSCSFSIGVEFENGEYIRATLTPHGSEPQVSLLNGLIRGREFVVDFDKEEARVDGEKSNVAFPMFKGMFPIPILLAMLTDLSTERIMASKKKPVSFNFELPKFANSSNRPYALAPIRSQPERTYNPTVETESPGGEHIPAFLARQARIAPDAWEKLRDRLNEVGTSSGLFSEISVKSYGKQAGDPFEIQVKVGKGPKVNLKDVGYGVSQALPLLVDALSKHDHILIQQPEVHLHPRAQAELGTFLGKLVATEKKRFVLETHSDYIVDRVRMDVRDGKSLKPEDVIILYFEKKGADSTIHPIRIDKTGNLLNAPASYRRFFMDEERRFWGD